MSRLANGKLQGETYVASGFVHIKVSVGFVDSLVFSGAMQSTCTLKSGEKSGNWDVKKCSISWVKANYTVILLTFDIYEGSANLYYNESYIFNSIDYTVSPAYS